MRQQNIRWVVVALCVVLLQGLVSHAQDTTLDLTLATEYEIGFTCPVASTQQPDTGIIWVLTDNCLGRKLSLQAYDLKSGDPIDKAPILLNSVDEFNGDQYGIYSYNPLAFALDGTLELFAGNNETDDVVKFHIDLDSGELTVDPGAEEDLNTFLRQFSQYPSFTNFSPDHTRATTTDDDGLVLYVLDLATQEVLLELDAIYAFAAFSSDMQQIYVNTPDEPDNFDNQDGTLSVYNLSDGALIQSFPLPISVPHPSPDGRYIAFQTATSDEHLGLAEIATGAVSPLLKIDIEPRLVVKCVNDDRSMTDYDFKTTGAMSLRSLHWLPDSSGFMTLNSYGAQASGSASNPCYFDNSRLRYYEIADS